MNGCVWTKQRASAVAVACGFAFGLLSVGISPSSATAAEFEVSPGHLSASVRDIVESYGWSLVWAADEDRVVDYPFAIGNGSLREALTDLLTVYRGQFVADLYEGNRVVLVDSAPPRIRVVLPDGASGNDDAGVVGPPVATAFSAAALPVVDARSASRVGTASFETGESEQSGASSHQPADPTGYVAAPEGLATRRVVDE